MSAAEGAGGERLRLFVALELPATVRETLVAWRARAAQRVDGLRLLDPAALHVTLCFLGWRWESELEPIAAVLGALEAGASPELRLGEARWLPSRRPRVLAVEVIDPAGVLRHAQSVLSEALLEGGWYQPETRPFLAHVTVARVAHGERVSPRTLPPPPACEFLGARVTLYRSRLQRTGARYDPLATVALGRNVSGEVSA